MARRASFVVLIIIRRPCDDRGQTPRDAAVAAAAAAELGLRGQIRFDREFRYTGIRPLFNVLNAVIQVGLKIALITLGTFDVGFSRAYGKTF